jgi:MazG family protein
VEDALDAINDKLIRRHPHVFGEQQAQTAGDVRRIWSEVKAAEKQKRGDIHETLLESIPRNLPALLEGQQIAARAAHAGFDWANVEQVIEKLHEELTELDAARRQGLHQELEEEVGDLLFVVINIARFLKVDSEQALRKTNAKFRKRFGFVERGLAERGKSLEAASLEEMEALWQESKR